MANKREYGLLLIAYIIVFIILFIFVLFGLNLNTIGFMVTALFFLSPMILLSIRRNGDLMQSSMVTKNFVYMFVIRLVIIMVTLFITGIIGWLESILVVLTGVVLMSAVYSAMDIILIHYWKSDYDYEEMTTREILEFVSLSIGKIVLLYILGYLVFAYFGSLILA